MSNNKRLAILVGFILGAVAAAYMLHAPIPTCEDAIIPIKAALDADDCHLAARNGSADHTIYGFVCKKTRTQVAILLAAPDSEIDNYALHDSNMIFLTTCRLSSAQLAHIYTHKSNLPVQQADDPGA